MGHENLRQRKEKLFWVVEREKLTSNIQQL